MQSITELEYFFWGSAHPQQFALYSPAINRFIVVDRQEQVLEYVCFLMSSKINLFLVPLHTAHNFTENLIDNSCCINWGIGKHTASSKRLSPKLMLTKSAYSLDSCDLLAQQHCASSDVHELQKIAFLIAHVVKFFRFSEHVMYTKFYDLLDAPFDTLKFDLIKQQEKKCYNLLHLCQDYASVVADIEDILQSCPLSLTTDD